MKVECGVCNRKVNQTDCEVIKLTEQEKKLAGEGAPDTMVYCKPCWRALTDPTTGPQVGRGLFLTLARQLGVRNPVAWANRYFDMVAKHAKKS